MPPHPNSNPFADALLAGGLVSAPAWAAWLGQLNQMLTTATLVLGLVFGLARLWLMLRDDRKPPRR